MGVVHFYYFLQLKIIWAIKLKTQVHFFPQVSVCLAIAFQVGVFFPLSLSPNLDY